jgi:hypothetical protein
MRSDTHLVENACSREVSDDHRRRTLKSELKYAAGLVLDQSDRPVLAALCRSSLRCKLVKSNTNGWSARIQLTGQRECKWVAKSKQLRSGTK